MTKSGPPLPPDQRSGSPDFPPRPEVRAEMETVPVQYYGFDGEVYEGDIEVNQAAADDIAAFFKLAFELEFPIDKIVKAEEQPYDSDDAKLMADNATSGFNHRFIADTDKLSGHANGLAIDVNPRQNPCYRFADGEREVKPTGAVWDPDVPGTLTEDHPLTQLLIDRGWEWGGNWTQESGRIDYHHFEKP